MLISLTGFPAGEIPAMPLKVGTGPGERGLP
jgi:hypothetical protein